MSVLSKSKSSTTKISPRLSKCIFLDYPQFHRDYTCYDFISRKIIISSPWMKRTYKEYSPLDSDYEFLDTEKEPSSLFKQILTTPTVNLPSQVENTVLPQALTQNVQSVHEAPRHTMPTRPKHSIRKPKQIISLLSETRSPLLKSQL